MKIALYSDIHSQYALLDAVMEGVDKENVDWEVVIGDMIMGGPEPS
ncbi:MAG: metallophosphoesterase [Nitrospinota bacterium]|jgi:predicted phosphodiesterase|nr:metallophosphoesterase [Nitrospinota bacterium]|tara:strand:- start:808 stop:945 length:138 start_codon:yes stop_codon:yes gene_type:complete